MSADDVYFFCPREFTLIIQQQPLPTANDYLSLLISDFSDFSIIYYNRIPFHHLACSFLLDYV